MTGPEHADYSNLEFALRSVAELLENINKGDRYTFFLRVKYFPNSCKVSYPAIIFYYSLPLSVQ